MTQNGKIYSFAAPVRQFLASIRLTIVLLLLLAFTSIMGTLISLGGNLV